DARPMSWIAQQFSLPRVTWVICSSHHPLYSHARLHGPDVDLRARLEPGLEKNGVDVVLKGHEHVYERIKPQRGINYFVLGNVGELRFHDLISSADMVKGFDMDSSLLMVEMVRVAVYF